MSSTDQITEHQFLSHHLISRTMDNTELFEKLGKRQFWKTYRQKSHFGLLPCTRSRGSGSSGSAYLYKYIYFKWNPEYDRPDINSYILYSVFIDQNEKKEVPPFPTILTDDCIEGEKEISGFIVIIADPDFTERIGSGSATLIEQDKYVGKWKYLYTVYWHFTVSRLLQLLRCFVTLIILGGGQAEPGDT